MSINSQKRVALAKIRLVMGFYKEEQDYESFENVLMGKGGFAVPTRDSMGRLYHDSNALIRALYDYHMNHPDEKVDKLLEFALIDIFKKVNNINYIQNAARVLQYHINYENQKTASFEMDCVEILKHYKQNLIKNETIYENNSAKENINNINMEITRLMEIRR